MENVHFFPPPPLKDIHKSKQINDNMQKQPMSIIQVLYILQT